MDGPWTPPQPTHRPSRISSKPTSPASPATVLPTATATSARCAVSAPGCAPPATSPTIPSAASARPPASHDRAARRDRPFARLLRPRHGRLLRRPGTGPGAAFLVTRNGYLRPGVRLRPNGLKQLLRWLSRPADVPRVHTHRFSHTFATWAIAHDAREPNVQHLLEHSSPGDDAPLQRHLRQRPGGGAPRRLLSWGWHAGAAALSGESGLAYRIKYDPRAVVTVHRH